MIKTKERKFILDQFNPSLHKLTVRLFNPSSHTTRINASAKNRKNFTHAISENRKYFTHAFSENRKYFTQAISENRRYFTYAISENRKYFAHAFSENRKYLVQLTSCMMATHVLLYVPNIIDYVRLALLMTSWAFYYTNSAWSLFLYTISISLDAVDGYAARKLNQCSAFGAWLDVVIDILGRGMLWSRLYHFGYLVAALEWLTFVCTHTLGMEWKRASTHTPWWVKQVMAENFKTPFGVVAIAGLQGLPMWLYGYHTGLLSSHLLLPSVSQYAGIAILSCARGLCVSVELWCLWSHIMYLISDDVTKVPTAQKTSTTTS